MLLHYLGKFKIRNFALFMHVKRFKCEFVPSIQQISSNVMKISANINTVQNINILLFSFTVLNKLKPLDLSKISLPTIKRQHSKNLT